MAKSAFQSAVPPPSCSFWVAPSSIVHTEEASRKDYFRTITSAAEKWKEEEVKLRSENTKNVQNNTENEELRNENAQLKKKLEAAEAAKAEQANESRRLNEQVEAYRQFAIAWANARGLDSYTTEDARQNLKSKHITQSSVDTILLDPEFQKALTKLSQGDGRQVEHSQHTAQHTAKQGPTTTPISSSRTPKVRRGLNERNADWNAGPRIPAKRPREQDTTSQSRVLPIDDLSYWSREITPCDIEL